MVVILLLIGVVSTFVLYYMYGQYKTRRIRSIISNIPGPTEYPVVGSALEFGRNGVELLENMQNIVTKYGPVLKAWLGLTPWVILTDSKDIEVILNSTTHLNKPEIYDFMKNWLGTGLVSTQAAKWKTQRKILTPAFHFKILETYIDIFNENARIMTSLLQEEVGKEKIDIAAYVDKCTLDVISETAMATSVRAQLNEESQFCKSLKVVSSTILVRAFKPWLFPDFTFNLSPIGREFNKNLQYVNNYVDNIIAQKKKSRAESKINESSLPLTEPKPEDDYYGTKKRYVFLDLLLMYADDPSVHMSDSDIRDEVNTFMFAGHDTTASTMGFAVYLLASHPDIQAKVVEELHSVFGDSDRDPTYQELQGLKYMEQVIKETLRLYPAVPSIGRLLNEDVTIPSGYTLPAGTSVSLFFFKVHRDPQVFSDPEKFNPDNFLSENMSNRFSFAYTPFSAGPRNCLGQKFAMLELKATLSRLFRTYKISVVPPEPVLATGLILRSDVGINVRLENQK